MILFLNGLRRGSVGSKAVLFTTAGKGNASVPSRLAGCPPDAFSPTGQLWGNPVYNWSAHARTEYRWWVARLRHALHWFDALRLDHFRGFAAYYSVPARAKTGPGRRQNQRGSRASFIRRWGMCRF